ncbi:MAG TPA: C4-dicarboxylate ABC transporter [Spirochaetaceae bacterium]|nr:C4-dicarboxylate ABC transporter [Spirochaetaceae bacterium]
MKKFYEFICKAEVFLAALCFSISCCLIFLAPVARTFDHPINWSQDMSLFLFAWSVFLSADAAFRADKLVNIDLLSSRFSASAKRVFSILIYCIILVFLGTLIWYGIKLSLFSRRRVFQGIPGFSYSWVTISIPVGGLLMAITSILKLRDLLIRRPVSSEGPGKAGA